MKCRTTSEKRYSPRSPEEGPKHLQLIVLLVIGVNHPVCMPAVDSLRDKAVAAMAWRLLSEINANLQRRNEDQSATEIALQHRFMGRSMRLLEAIFGNQTMTAWQPLEELATLARENRDSVELLARVGACRGGEAIRARDGL
jgi:hypothetical protein